MASDEDGIDNCVSGTRSQHIGRNSRRLQAAAFPPVCYPSNGRFRASELVSSVPSRKETTWNNRANTGDNMVLICAARADLTPRVNVLGGAHPLPLRVLLKCPGCSMCSRSACQVEGRVVSGAEPLPERKRSGFPCRQFSPK